MHEVDDELRDIKREIIESRGLVIKTNNLTNALSADLKSIAKRQGGYERRISWNSATAYVVFVLVVFVALKFAWDTRVDAIRTHVKVERTRVNAIRTRPEVGAAWSPSASVRRWPVCWSRVSSRVSGTTGTPPSVCRRPGHPRPMSSPR